MKHLSQIFYCIFMSLYYRSEEQVYLPVDTLHIESYYWGVLAHGSYLKPGAKSKGKLQ